MMDDSCLKVYVLENFTKEINENQILKSINILILYFEEDHLWVQKTLRVTGLSNPKVFSPQTNVLLLHEVEWRRAVPTRAILLSSCHWDSNLGPLDDGLQGGRFVVGTQTWVLLMLELNQSSCCWTPQWSSLFSWLRTRTWLSRLTTPRPPSERLTWRSRIYRPWRTWWGRQGRLPFC